MQVRMLRAHATSRGWTVVDEIRDVGSGAGERPNRDVLMKAARRRDLDAIVVWRLDRWGRSLADLVVSLKEMHELGVGFVSLTEALDLTTPTGRAMAGLLGVFAEFEREILRERVCAGLAQAKREGRQLGRPRTASLKGDQVRDLFAQKLSQAEIARRLSIGRTSVRRILHSSPQKKRSR
jgi:DNA invertase Pin-like site-specific DNA recombinase